MTSPLVNPVSGYSTLSRLVSVSCAPVDVDGAPSPRCQPSPLASSTACPSRTPRNTGCRSRPSSVHADELDLDDDLRLDPVRPRRPERRAARRRRAASARHGRAVAAAARRSRPVSPLPTLPAYAQPPSSATREDQRAQRRRVSAARLPADDREVAGADEAQLAPVVAAHAGPVDASRAAWPRRPPAVLARHRLGGRAVVEGRAQRPARRARRRTAPASRAARVRPGGEVDAVAAQHVEDHEGHRVSRRQPRRRRPLDAHVHPGLQQLEGRPAVDERHDLAVEQGVADVARPARRAPDRPR